MLSVTIPALTEPNSRLKLRGEGFTDPRNSIVGDFLLQVEVIPPDSLSHEHANLIQRIKQERRRNN
jgi:DnaJ-class molecular chaperone